MWIINYFKKKQVNQNLDSDPLVSKLVETQFICNFGSSHRIRQILFVGKDQQDSIAQLVFLQLHTSYFATSNNSNIHKLVNAVI